MSRINAGIIRIILCAIFLTSGFIGQAGALTYLSRTKDIRIDSEWRITGRYTSIIEVSGAADFRKVQEMIQQFRTRGDQSAPAAVRVRLPDGSDISWEAMEQHELPAGARICLTVAITKEFPGFSGLFADNMQIDQDDAIKNVSYRIQFPGRTFLISQIRQNTGTRESTNYTDCFNWSGNDVNRLEIFISTATSWQQISQRYQALFENRLDEGLVPADLPDKLKDTPALKSTDEKIRAVMRFLKNDFIYRRSPASDHGLSPAAPLSVLHRGWGDCKDLSLLATAILRSMGIDTFVVLTGRPRLNSADSAIPDPFIFDHALVGYRQNGKTAYYDCLATDYIVAVNDQYVYLPLKVSNHDDQ
jgi:hypothetical protein